VRSDRKKREREETENRQREETNTVAKYDKERLDRGKEGELRGRKDRRDLSRDNNKGRDRKK
jgi:hypothetical protein